MVDTVDKNESQHGGGTMMVHGDKDRFAGAL
jgi:hypothetical protein